MATGCFCDAHCYLCFTFPISAFLALLFFSSAFLGFLLTLTKIAMFIIYGH